MIVLAVKLGLVIISDLVDLMKNGGAYVNVHTNQNQNGEIRGQIMSG